MTSGINLRSEAQISVFSGRIFVGKTHRYLLCAKNMKYHVPFSNEKFNVFTIVCVPPPYPGWIYLYDFVSFESIIENFVEQKGFQIEKICI